VNHKIKIIVDGKRIYTLEDILPPKPGLKVLFIAKTPAPCSVEKGHYFQGRQGTSFWNKLTEYGLLSVPPGKFHDDYLLQHNYGITDIVKVPRNYGDEPSYEEYREGIQRIFDLIKIHKPKVVVFVYKGVLDKILELNFNINEKSDYGFNDNLNYLFEDARVFVFPMPSTRCIREEIKRLMSELQFVLNK